MNVDRPNFRALSLLILMTFCNFAAAAEKSATGHKGMVAASTPYATQAAVRILEQGGNAVDAAVAACFALTVTDPGMTSLGGRLHMVFALADGTRGGIDGATQAPSNVPPLAGTNDSRLFYRSAPIPGNPAALDQALKKYGRLKLSVVLQPAIEYAENGFQILPEQARAWQTTLKDLSGNPGAKANFLKPDGTGYKADDLFRQPTLAHTLRQLAESGTAAFYQGRWHRRSHAT